MVKENKTGFWNWKFIMLFGIVSEVHQEFPIEHLFFKINLPKNAKLNEAGNRRRRSRQPRAQTETLDEIWAFHNNPTTIDQENTIHHKSLTREILYKNTIHKQKECRGEGGGIHQGQLVAVHKRTMYVQNHTDLTWWKSAEQRILELKLHRVVYPGF